MFPVWEWSPCECSPVLLVGDFRFLIEFKDFAGVRVNAVDELLERRRRSSLRSAMIAFLSFQLA